MAERLTTISVSGYRSLASIRDLELRSLNVLIGANGSGKSNVLSLFQMLSYMMSEGLQLYVGRKGGANSLLHLGARKTPAITASLEFAGHNVASRYHFTLAHAQPDTLQFADETLEFRNVDASTPFVAPLGAGHTESRVPAMAGAQQDSARNRAARVFQRRLTEVKEYHFHDTSDRAPIRLMQEASRNRFLQSDGGNLAAYLLRLREAYPDHFRHIQDTVRLVMPFLREFILEPEHNDIGRSVMLRWRGNDLDYEFGPHQLPDGGIRAIALVTLLLQPADLAASTILIDEPELGLHPFAVGLIGQLIRGAATDRQIVVATQSARLLREFAPEDVLVVEKQDDASTITRLSSDDLGGWLEDYDGDLGVLFDRNVTGGAPA